MSKTKRAITWLVIACVWIVLAGILAMVVSRGRDRTKEGGVSLPGIGYEQVSLDLPKIWFRVGTKQPDDRSIPDLDAVARMLKEEPKYRVTIIGYSMEPDPKEARRLAGEKAEFVRKWFLRENVPESQIGETRVVIDAPKGPGVTFAMERKKAL